MTIRDLALTLDGGPALPPCRPLDPATPVSIEAGPAGNGWSAIPEPVDLTPPAAAPPSFLDGGMTSSNGSPPEGPLCGPDRTVRRIVLFAAWTGALGSISANVLQCYRLTPVGADAGWSPDWAYVVWSGLLPLWTFLGIEIAIRVPWPRGLPTAGAWTTCLGLAGISCYVSYLHMRGLSILWHEPSTVSMVAPLIADGIMILATLARLVLPTTKERS
jgi:hypothetical protein